MSLENCPKCTQKLGSPLKSSGRQVCMKCGWSDKPRQKADAPVSQEKELSLEEIKQLLRTAETEALENMKPRKPKEGIKNPLDQYPPTLNL